MKFSDSELEKFFIGTWKYFNLSGSIEKVSYKIDGTAIVVFQGNVIESRKEIILDLFGVLLGNGCNLTWHIKDGRLYQYISGAEKSPLNFIFGAGNLLATFTGILERLSEIGDSEKGFQIEKVSNDELILKRGIGHPIHKIYRLE
jgi:hypothetical protein